MRLFSVFSIFLLLVSCSEPYDESKAGEFLDKFETGELDRAFIHANINSIDETGVSPLYHTLDTNPHNSSIVARLLASGADPFQKQLNGFYPIRKMMHKDQASNFKFSLCSRRESAERFYGEIEGNSIFDIFSSPLFDAAVNGNAEHISALDACGIDLNTRNREGKAALQLAIPVNIETFAALINRGANPEPVREEICEAINRIYLEEQRKEFFDVLPQQEEFCST